MGGDPPTLLAALLTLLAPLEYPEYMAPFLTGEDDKGTATP